MSCERERSDREREEERKREGEKEREERETARGATEQEGGKAYQEDIVLEEGVLPVLLEGKELLCESFHGSCASDLST